MVLFNTLTCSIHTELIWFTVEKKIKRNIFYNKTHYSTTGKVCGSVGSDNNTRILQIERDSMTWKLQV